jgi:hypothetical protein
VNGKVYDATVSLDIQTGSRLTELNAVLDGYAPTIPARAYPAEPEQTLQLTPSPTTPGSYSGQITGLLGGKQYQLSVTARDSQACEATAQFQTPYVREFENISDEDDVLVGALYYPMLQRFWHEAIGATDDTTANGTPLLGLYDSSDPMVICKHIDWATGHGIDFFWISYEGYGSEVIPSITQNPLIGDVRFAMVYETAQRLAGTEANLSTIDLANSATYDTLQSDIENLAKGYFAHPSYLRVNGNPVVYLYATSSVKSVETQLPKLRDDLRSLGFEIYLVGQELDWGYMSQLSRLKSFDATTTWIPTPQDFASYLSSPNTIDAQYEQWREATEAAGIDLIPTIIHGFDNRAALYTNTHTYYPRSPELFKATISVAKNYLTKNRIMRLVSFNEWFESTNVEPSVEDGFKYLQTLRDTLAGH